MCVLVMHRVYVEYEVVLQIKTTFSFTKGCEDVISIIELIQLLSIYLVK
jgi:hypothetical protein